MNNVMPDPISSMGRAVQAKTSNMTPEQVAQVDQQYAQMGLTSINDVITLKQQLDRLKQAQQAQAPQATVAQDLMQQMQQMNGIAALPSNVGSPQAYARGGIVAFANAGSVPGGITGSVPGEILVDDYGYPLKKDPNTGKWVRFGTESHVYPNPAEVGPQQTARSKLGTVLRKPISAAGVKSLGTSLLKKGYIPAVATTGAFEVGRTLAGDPIPIENIREYMADKKLIGEDERTGSKYPGIWGAVDDAGLRLGSLFMNSMSLGMGGPKRTPKAPELPVDEAAQDNVDMTGVDFLKYLDKNGTGGGLASLQINGLNPNIADAAMSGVINTAQQRVGEAPDERAEIEKQMQLMKEYNIGASAAEDRARYERDKQEIPEDKRRDKWLAAAKAFGAMGLAAGEGGATLGGAAAAGIAKGAEEYGAVLDKYRDVEDKINDKLSEVSRYEEALRAGGIQRGSARYDSLLTKRDNALAHVETLQAKEAELKIQIAVENMKQQTDLMIARAQQAGKGLEAERVREAYIAASLDPSPNGQKAAAYYYSILETLAKLAPPVQARIEGNQPAYTFNSGTPAAGQSGQMQMVGVRPDKPAATR